MVYLLSEIGFGLVTMVVAGFCLGWVVRGIRERIHNGRSED